MLVESVSDFPNVNLLRIHQCEVLRDIIGNPFAPPVVNESCRAQSVRCLAQEIYESREFGKMASLKSSLLQAGCNDDDILSHFDQKTPHVLGCWLLDLILEK